MNIPIQTRERLNHLDYYMMCICYYIVTFTMIFTILNYNLFQLTIIYFTYNYISTSLIIIISNVMNLCMVLHLLGHFDKFMKDILCMCYTNNEYITNTTSNTNTISNDKYNDKIKIDNKSYNTDLDVQELVTFLHNNNYTNEYEYDLECLDTDTDTDSNSDNDSDINIYSDTDNSIDTDITIDTDNDSDFT